MPVELKGSFCRQRVMDPSKCAKGSFRTVVQGKARIVICCPKGKFSGGRCEVGTRAQAILRPPVAGRCPAR